MTVENITNLANKKKTHVELFNELITAIKETHETENDSGTQLSNNEARKTALRLIGFYKKFIDIEVRIEREAQQELEPG